MAESSSKVARPWAVEAMVERKSDCMGEERLDSRFKIQDV
jgi:hypothetical protein